MAIKHKTHQFPDRRLYQFVLCFSVGKLIPPFCPNIFVTCRKPPRLYSERRKFIGKFKYLPVSISIRFPQSGKCDGISRRTKVFCSIKQQYFGKWYGTLYFVQSQIFNPALQIFGTFPCHQGHTTIVRSSPLRYPLATVWKTPIRALQ